MQVHQSGISENTVQALRPVKYPLTNDILPHSPGTCIGVIFISFLEDNHEN